MLEVQIFTLYPDLYPGLLDVGIYKKAKEQQKWSLKIVDIRDYAFDNNRTVDDTPFGGGSGMLLRPDVVASALDQNLDRNLGYIRKLYERQIWWPEKILLLYTGLLIMTRG